MKKFFSFLAMSAIVLGMASCGDGNEPEVQNFQFQVKFLSSKADVTVTPLDKEKYFYSDLVKASKIDEAGGLEAYMKGQLESQAFITYVGGLITKKEDHYRPNNLAPETKYVAIACYVENGSDNYGKVVGKIEYVEFTTLKKNILNGVFSVNSEGKKVNFYSSNMGVDPANGKSVFDDDQYWCPGEASATNVVHDLLPFANATDATHTVLSKEEWWYLFKERDHAENLIAHATVCNKRGLIILPDNWQGVPGITFTPISAMSDFRWIDNDKEYSAESSFDAYDKNKFDGDNWDQLEYAGAVFLPAALENNTEGVYWTSTNLYGHGDHAHFFALSQNKLQLAGLKGTSRNYTYTYSIRPVKEVK